MARGRAAVVIQDPDQAPDQIDETIAACLRSRRPVYIEIPMDMVAQPCRPTPSFFLMNNDGYAIERVFQTVNIMTYRCGSIIGYRKRLAEVGLAK